MRIPIKKILLMFLLVLPFLFLASCASAPQKVEKPNLIVIIIDTLRADHLGCYGYTKIRTRSIDRLASEGLLFKEAFCQVPTTLPSHCSIFTGRYPAAHGVRHNGLFKLGQSEVTLAEVLKERDFETGAFIGAYVLNSGFGLEQGFDTYRDIRIDPRDQRPGNQLLEAQRVAEKVNEDFFAWLPTVKEKRFFAWVHYYDPHFPYSPPESENRRLEGKGYDREISYSDQCLGDLLAKLKELGILDRSILLFASDHGESLGEHSEDGHGIFIYDCSVRVPLILRAPWMIKPGKTFNGMFETVDIMPTLLGLLDLPVPPSVQGQNFAPALREGKYDEGKKESYAESYVPTYEYGWSELKSIRREEKKYIEAPIPELYDLAKDPRELTNLCPTSPDEVREMKNALAGMISRISSPEANPNEFQQPDEEKLRILKSLGYLSGDYFKSGKVEPGKGRIDPKIGIKEKNMFFKAAALTTAGRVEEALAGFREILQKNPKNYQARLVIIKILLAKRDVEKALEEAQGAIKIAEFDPTAMIGFGPELWNMYGSLLEKKGDHEGALKAYRKGFEMNPNKEISFSNLANLYLSRQEFDRALGVANDALKEHPGSVPINSFLIRLYTDMKETEKAVKVAKQLLSLDLSNDTEALLLVARTLYEQNAYPEAEQAYQKLAVADPLEYSAYYYIGLIDLQRNDEAHARVNLEKALSLNPGFSEAHDALGAWLKKRGRKEEARKAFTEALRLDPGDQVAMKELKSLQEPSP